MLAAMLITIASTLQAQNDDAAQIELLIRENLQATQDEDLERMLSTIHTQSPSYEQTKKMCAPLFEQYDLSYTLINFSYIGSDGEYAVARIKQITAKVNGPAFNNNQLDVMHVFRKENGQWKFWSQAMLEITYLE